MSMFIAPGAKTPVDSLESTRNWGSIVAPGESGTEGQTELGRRAGVRAGESADGWDRLKPTIRSGSHGPVMSALNAFPGGERPANDSSTGLVVELLNRARAGDESARDALFEQCRHYLSILARVQIETWLQAKVDPSDLVQQTLLEAYRGLARFEGQSEGEWLAWLKQILKHNATDFVRSYKGTAKRRIQKEVPMEAPRHGSSLFRLDPSGPGETPSQLVMQHESEIQLADAVSQLAEDYQEVILLRNVRRLSFNEVAEEMGRSRPAVQMLWLRALKKLKEQLQDVERA